MFGLLPLGSRGSVYGLACFAWLCGWPPYLEQFVNMLRGRPYFAWLVSGTGGTVGAHVMFSQYELMILDALSFLFVSELIAGQLGDLLRWVVLRFPWPPRVRRVLDGSAFRRWYARLGRPRVAVEANALG